MVLSLQHQQDVEMVDGDPVSFGKVAEGASMMESAMATDLTTI